MSYLSNIVVHSHQFLNEVLKPGDLALDLTAGTGSDTLFLARAVGATGRVVAFDIQEQALAATALKLEKAGVSVVRLDTDSPENNEPGVTLIAAGHERLSEYLDAAPKGIIANLGYLPGGDKNLVTRPDSTVLALQQATEALAVTGRLTVVVYPGHPGGAEEGALVDAFFKALPLKKWNVLRIEVPNGSAAPYLLVAEKR